MRNDEQDVNQFDVSSRKPYSAPRLVVYGDLRTITQNMMMAGSDGGAGKDNFST